MRRKPYRCESRTRDNQPIPVAVPVAPSESFITVDSLCALAQEHGWAGRAGFECAMQMFIAGLSPGAAAQMFLDAAKRLQ